jgi:hypothetical protein
MAIGSLGAAQQQPQYPLLKGLHAIPEKLLDMRPNFAIDGTLTRPPDVTNEKNLWFFWHSGYVSMPGYLQRNVRAYQRRFAKQGWAIRVLDRVPGSASNVSRFLDVTDDRIFPRAFIDDKVGGNFASQHTSDMIRFPLLCVYGGFYADVGLLQIGNLDALWNATLADPNSPYEVVSYDGDGTHKGRSQMNYFLGARKGSEFYAQCHKLFLHLWEGDRKDTTGLWDHPLLRGPPMMWCPPFETDGVEYTMEEASKMTTDYLIQGRVISMVMGLVDEQDGWNGPEYTHKHVFSISFMDGAQLINGMTAWNGQRAFDSLSLFLPQSSELETEDQKEARTLVEACLTRSFAIKLAHGKPTFLCSRTHHTDSTVTGMIQKVFGDTLGTLWRLHEGSDNVPGTYAHWIRYAIEHWDQDSLPDPIKIPVGDAFRRGPLLGLPKHGAKL